MKQYVHKPFSDYAYVYIVHNVHSLKMRGVHQEVVTYVFHIHETIKKNTIYNI